MANKELAAGKSTADAFDAPDVRLAVYPGTIQQALAARRFPKATMVVVEPDANEMDLVLTGKVHGALVPTFAPEVLLAQAGDSVAIPLAEPLQRTSTAMAIRKGDPDFLNALNSWLVYQRDGGWLAERAAHWAAAQRQP